jgi:phosphotriesterase-related protein
MTHHEPRTVGGRPLAPAYDVVLAHEHVFIDIRCWLDESDPETRHLRDRSVDATTVADVQRNPFACLDNLVLDNASLVAGDLRELARNGRTLVVDVTPANVGRDVAALAEVSRVAGVDIVCGCGRYIAQSRPDDDPALGAEGYRDEILAELEAPGPRPAVIGEIGTGDPILPIEAASLQGAAMAQAQTGLPLYVHLHPWARRGHEALDLVAAAGGDLSRTVLCHLDPQIPGGIDYHRELLARGATIAFDIWGDEYRYGAVSMPSDEQRIAATAELVANGYGAQLVHSHDVCTKTQLRTFGGVGYDHLPRAIAPRLRAAGLGADEVRRQLAGNALALLNATERGITA